MKLLVKVCKNLTCSLYSDQEEKGKRKRMKKIPKRLDSDEDGERLMKRKTVHTNLPPVPTLTVEEELRLLRKHSDEKKTMH
jgi:hypothetical protein